MHFRPRYVVWIVYAFRLGWIMCGTVGFVWRIVRGWLMSFGWIAREWLFGLCGIAWQNMVEIGRGGACVPAPTVSFGWITRGMVGGVWVDCM